LAVGKVIGIEFVPGIARAVAVSGTRTRYSIGKVGELSLPVREEMPEQFLPDEGSIALQQWFNELGLRGFRSAFTFQERKSILRVLEVPPLNEEELMRTIYDEFNEAMEESLENYSIDFSVLGRVVHKEESEDLRVLVAIVPRGSIFPFADALQRIRIPPVRVNLPVLASLSAITATKPELLEGNVVCFHLDMIGGDVLIFSDGELVFLRRVTIGMKELKYAFANLVEQTPPEQVENIGGYKLDEYSVPEEHFSFAMPIVQMIHSEIERTLSFYRSQIQVSDYAFERIVLCGSGVWPLNLDEVLMRETSREAVVSNPLLWAGDRLTTELTSVQEMSLVRYSTAFGIGIEALRE